MRSFINAICSFLLSRLEPYLNQNTNTPQTQPVRFGRTVEQLEFGDDRVNKKPSNESYRHHKRTSAGSEDNVSDFDRFSVPLTSEPSSLTEISKESVTCLQADEIEASSRLDLIAGCVTPYDDPNLTLDTSTTTTATETDDLDISSISFEPPSTPDLPSESFFPLLRANRLALDADASRNVSRFGLATATGKESRPLFGLGIFDVSREEECSHAFDGLGIVRIHSSSPWRRQKSKMSCINSGGGSLGEHSDDEQDNTDTLDHISETFLHDLEAFFLARDRTTPSPSRSLSFSSHCSSGGELDNSGLMFDIVEKPTTKSGEAAPTFFAPVPAAQNSRNHHDTLSSRTPTPASKNPARRIKRALSLKSSRIQATTSSSLATATPTCMPTPSSTAFVRRTCSAFTLSRDASSKMQHYTVPPESGPNPSLSRNMNENESHSVRDLSVIGTISSNLKRKMSV